MSIKRWLKSSCTLAILGVFLVSQLGSTVHALPPGQQKVFDGGGIQIFNIEPDVAATDPCATGAAGSVTLAGSDNIERAFNYFVTRGLTPFQSAGIVGNLVVESGVDPLIVQSSGYGHGIAQWETVIKGKGSGRWDVLPPRNGKPANVKSFAASPEGGNRSMTDLGLQLDFLWHELTNFYTSSLAKIKTAPSFGSAAVTFLVEVEAPAERSPTGNNARVRTQTAGEILAKYGNGAPTGTTSQPALAGCNASGGIGVGSTLTFPLVTTKTLIKANKPDIWCYTNQNNCHHDYKAADIMIGEGTQVIAAAPGVVQQTSNIQGKNAAVTVLGDDNNVYFYQHMAPGSLVLAKGARVTAGAPLGKIGNRAAAFGTDTHLHFDMSPPPAKFRPSCKGAACSGLPFINVQPALIDAFQKLPE